ncbi:dynamin-related protein 4C-like [Iris pallida]|uniref:Dynamin-related protein 4C-like n=1 Tax=Iris pallida TaxID=29817 RepID=A0AAX6E7P5_IRIPA|nr:dynamin-related protein 4C-like [Iris pallida]
MAKTKVEEEETAALASSYNEHIRPLLEAIDRLRHLKVMQTIVVVGDQSSGKSSVLESLTGISLPRGQGICTRVPLIMRLQDDPDISEPCLHLEYKDKRVESSESGITAAINAATEEIAGNGKGISSTPLTLVIKKNGVPDLTMVDLPGITRVPVHGQPDNIYEQIATIIKEYITPKESIILNVLSAAVDFPTCESIRMSQQVDRTGERTLVVVTKADRAPDGLLEKVTVDAVNIGLGYVCVRNRLGDESYAEARAKEARLFRDHPMLSKIDKSTVGIPVLAQRLMQIQAASIAKCLQPDIVKKINKKLNQSVAELNQSVADLGAMPQNLNGVAEAMRAFMHMVSMTKESLRNILIRGDYDDDDFKDDTEMHGKARLADMLDKYRKELPAKCPSSDDLFLMEEIRILEESSGIGIPNSMLPNALLNLLQRKAKEVSHAPQEFVRRVWGYIEDVVVKVLMKHCGNYPQLQTCTQRAAHNLIKKKRSQSYQVVKEIIEMETVGNYPSNPDYMKTWSELIEPLEEFMEVIDNQSRPTVIKMEHFGGDVEIGHLRQNARLAEQAYDMRMRLTLYWRMVVLRLPDSLGLHVLHAVKTLVEEELEKEIVSELSGPGSCTSQIERRLKESPVTAGKIERLRRRSIELLKEMESKIMDCIGSNGD